MSHPCHSLTETVEQVLALPAILRYRGNVSLLGLVTETGYPRHAIQIDEALLREVIATRPGVVTAWLGYSAEKREDWGWFFEGPDDGEYLVGSRTCGLVMPRHFADASEACASFIKEEVEAVLGRKPFPPRNPVAGRTDIPLPAG